MDDILETVHHFRAIDYVIDKAEEELSEEIIKHLHFLLKHDTKDSTLSWFTVGDYKKRANVVGGHETAKPKEVPHRMRELLSEYNSKANVTIEDIVAFHADFEYIHPFQDGNELRKSKVRDLPSPQAFHPIEIEVFNADDGVFAY